MSGAGSAQVTIPEWTAELVDAYESEARQLETLVGILRRQRDGIAHDEITCVQDSVSAIHRVLLTLDEARKRRRTLLEIVSTAERDDARAAERVSTSKQRLITAARALETELSLNRSVLESALESTDAEIRTLLAAGDHPPTYANEPDPATGSGRLVDRQA